MIGELKVIIGVPKEIKTHEYRVGLIPGSVRELTRLNHTVLIETMAGVGVGFSDEDYIQVGATIVPTASKVFESSDIIIKVKEPQPSETAMLRPDQVLFTYLHLSSDPVQAMGLIQSKCVAIAYETVTDNFGRLPLLSPMSEVAGRMSIQVGATYLEKPHGGAGVLLGGVAGVEPARVCIIGGGVVGISAARMAVGLGAKVTIIDRSVHRLQEIDQMMGSRIRTVYSTFDTIEYHVLRSDLVIGAVLIPGATAPRLVTRDMIGRMKKGSVLVDVAIDQGGCFETSKATTHQDPIYVIDGIIHYCVANMPGAVARTSAMALNNATLPYILALAQKGYRQALHEDRHLLNGLTVYRGAVTNEAVAQGLSMPYLEIGNILTA